LPLISKGLTGFHRYLMNVASCAITWLYI